MADDDEPLTPEQLARCAFKKVDIGEGFVEITIRVPSDDTAPELCYGSQARDRITTFVLAAASGLCAAAGVDADLVLKQVEREFVGSAAGVCRVCGCTDDHACFGGCHWVDDQHTLCSGCVG